ncbi:hypothetical protein LSH36_250g01032 [Paralvinella palmiformis]|uniref:PPM-type phosphatase domain-containing protein n=1 Tax=Paralvinella palmiformis TaxID=53620 RepID=A0AAD9JN30_9ANNE|nr:hypothetical protein LSH36_250g01032 [Paralvinella palmiformis]
MARALQPTREYHRLNGILKSLVCASSLWTRPKHCLKQLPWLLTHAREKHEELFPQRLVLPESKGYVPILSPTQVSSLLRSNEASEVINYNLVGQTAIRGFESNQLASNHPTEDRRAVGKLLQTGGTVFGVYDGHGGAACAQSVSERLLDYIAVSMLSHEELEQFSHALETDGQMDLVQRYAFANGYVSESLQEIFRTSLHRYVVENLSFAIDDLDEDQKPTDVIGCALTSAFTRLDADISSEVVPTRGIINVDALEVGLSGACACVAHIHDLDLNVANLGDCRAVIGQLTDHGEWRPIQLTNDHKPENQKEAQRLLASHPMSESANLLKNSRLLGLLVPLRAFGDIRFKWNLHDLKVIAEFLENQFAQNLIPKNYYTPPYLFNQPEVHHYSLSRRDKFMVIGTDGLWDMLSNQEVVNLVGGHLEGKLTTDRFRLKDHKDRRLGAVNMELVKRKTGLSHKGGDANCATHLIRHALGYEHRLVSDMLTFPPYISRLYRDDITITIVYFDEIFLSASTPDMQ